MSKGVPAGTVRADGCVLAAGRFYRRTHPRVLKWARLHNNGIVPTYTGWTPNIPAKPEPTLADLFRPKRVTPKRGTVRRSAIKAGPMELRHNAAVVPLYDLLAAEHGEEHVAQEQLLPGGCVADHVVEHEDGSFTIYERKTTPTFRQDVREAVGQLLEYGHMAHVPIRRLVIVGSNIPTPEEKDYLLTLRERHGIHYEFA
jgi:hypothetical protein